MAKVVSSTDWAALPASYYGPGGHRVLRTAAAVFRTTGHRRELGMALTNLGEICIDVGRLDESLTYLHEALANCRTEHDTWRRHRLILPGYSTYRGQETSLAIANLQQALATAENVGDLRHLGHVLATLGANIGVLDRYRYEEVTAAAAARTRAGAKGPKLTAEPNDIRTRAKRRSRSWSVPDRFCAVLADSERCSLADR